MSRVSRRNRPLLRLIVAVALVLLGGMAILGAKARFFPDVAAEASTAYSRGEWDRAASLALRRLKEAPDDPKALRLAARAAARQDQDQKSIAIYRRLPVEGQDAEDLFLLGRAHARAGQIGPAYEAYHKALERDPAHPEALAALAALYVSNDRFHAAAEVAERLARQPASEARAQAMLGRIRSEVDDNAGAARALRRGLELDPDGRAIAPLPVASVRKLLAGSLLRIGQPAEAQAVLEGLLRAGPDPEASWLLSRCFLQAKDRDRASAELQQHPSYRSEHPLEPEPAPYVGEARCAECHREQSVAVLASRHARTFARARELSDLPLPRDSLPDPGNPRVKHHLRRQGDSLVVETRKDDRVRRAVVDYAFGSRDHFMTFVGRDDRGGSVMIRMSCYESPRGTGWDIATGLPRQPAKDEEYLGDPMFPGDGVRRCLACHTTSVHAVVHEEGPAAADRSIGCERCHGPGGHHVAAVAAGLSDPAIVSPGAAPTAATDRLCEKCHGIQRPPGLDIPRTDPVWLRFQSLTLPWSRCYTESDGTLGCVTCHDPHRNAETSVVRNEAKCLSCHAPDPRSKSSGSSPSGERRAGAPGTLPAPASQGGEHSTELHAPLPPPLAQGGFGGVGSAKGGTGSATAAGTPCPVNPARGCIECHMPRIWVQSTHSFKTDHFIRVREQAPAESRAPAVH
jgi:tetratricopeptide (TPR) repeat protein